MTPEQIVYQTLSADAGITAIVGTRISPMHSLETGELPCITYLILGAQAEYTQDEPVNLQDPLVQIDLWAEYQDYTGLKSLREAVLNALYGSDSPLIQRYYFVTNDGMDIIDPDPRIARKMIQARLWYDRTK